MSLQFTITDDSGVLALVDCAAYDAFIDEDWQLDQLLAHVRAKRLSILLWNAGGGGGNYRITVRTGISVSPGYRSMSSRMRVTNSGLHLVSYSALTMAAQYADEKLPSAREAAFMVPLDNGAHRVRLVQTFDPDQADAGADGSPHFVLELQAGAGESSENIAWFDP